MKCPKCQTKMTKGFVTITASAFGYLMTALTRPYCAFYPAAGTAESTAVDTAQDGAEGGTGSRREKHIVKGGDKYKLAYHCATCQLFIVENRNYNPQYPTPPGFIEVKTDDNDPGISI